MKKKRARELELVGHAGISCVNKDESEQSVALQASAEKSVHGVAELELAGHLKITNNSVSHMSIRRFSNLKYGILYMPLGKLDTSL